jgi:hypothetical protein
MTIMRKLGFALQSWHGLVEIVVGIHTLELIKRVLSLGLVTCFQLPT